MESTSDAVMRDQKAKAEGPQNQGRNYKKWLASLRSTAATPNPLTRQLRRAMLRAEVWGRWEQYLYNDPKTGQLRRNVPTDEQGPMPRRVRRAIAIALFHNLEKEAKAQADKIRGNPEELQALAERFAAHSKQAHDTVVRINDGGSK